MKVVLDTNVFISGVFWNGSPQKILDLWMKNKVEVFVTKSILNEYLRVLREIDRSDHAAEKWGVFITEHTTIVPDKRLVHMCRDPDDDKFLDCALIADADCIVSGDKDLLSLKSVGGIKIVTPSLFLKESR